MYQILSALINQIKFIYHTNCIQTYTYPGRRKWCMMEANFGEPDALTKLEGAL